MSHCEWLVKYDNECGELVWLTFCTAKLEILLVFKDLILMEGLYMGDIVYCCNSLRITMIALLVSKFELRKWPFHLGTIYCENSTLYWDCKQPHLAK